MSSDTSDKNYVNIKIKNAFLGAFVYCRCSI